MPLDLPLAMREQQEALRLWEEGRLYEAEMAFLTANDWFGQHCADSPDNCTQFHLTFGKFLAEMNNLTQAQAQFETALRQAQAHFGPQSLEAGTILQEYGRCRMMGLDFNLARDQFQEASEIFQLHRPKQDPKLVGIYSLMAWTTVWLEDNEKTDYYLKLASEAAKGIPPHFIEIADLHHQYGNYYVNLNKYDLARASYLKAIEIRSKLPQTRELKMAQARTISNLGILEQDRKDFQAARGYFLQAASLFEAAVGPSHFRRCNMLEWTGETYSDARQYTTSLLFLNQALQGMYPDYKPTNDHSLPSGLVANGEEVASAILQAKAMSLEALADSSDDHQRLLVAALAHYKRSIDLLDSTRLDMAGLESRAYLIWRMKPSLEGGLRVCLQLMAETNDPEYGELAIDFFEKLKATTQLSTLASERVLQNLSPTEQKWIEEDRATSFDIQNYRRQLSSFLQEKDSTPATVQNEVRERFLEATARRKEIRDSISAFSPQYFSLKYNLQNIGLAEIQAKMRADEVLLEYASTDSSYWGMVITKTAYQWQNLGKRAEIDSLIAHFRSVFNPNSVGDRDSRLKWIEQSTQLHHALLGPFYPLIPPQSTIIILPDGELERVPFELLLQRGVGPNESTSWSKLDYLLKYHPIAYANSASIYFGFQDLKRPRPTGGVLAMAPEFGGNKLQHRSNVSALQFTEREVRGIARIFPTEMVIGPAATEAYFRENAPHFNILHLATHGIVDLKDPQDSHILLSPDPANPKDGSLYLSELMNMHLTADLVVLSACNTGNGLMLEGEGAVSLARAFQYAGCPSVVMSMWEVDDLATAKMMELFYQHLAAGETKPQALRNAKLDYLATASPERTHPWFWAGFIQNGDTQPLEDTGVPMWVWLLMGGLALGGLIFATEKDWL